MQRRIVIVFQQRTQSINAKNLMIVWFHIVLPYEIKCLPEMFSVTSMVNLSWHLVLKIWFLKSRKPHPLPIWTPIHLVSHIKKHEQCAVVCVVWTNSLFYHDISVVSITPFLVIWLWSVLNAHCSEYAVSIITCKVFFENYATFLVFISEPIVQPNNGILPGASWY